MTAPAQHQAVRNEQVLARQLSATQQTTMALGTAIGTGLFLATGLSVNVAGPATILSYVIVAVVSLLLGQALKEMAVAHPTAGAFGVYAAMYISPFAGYAVRVSYWLMQVIATGGQLVASSIYMAYWFPQVPGAVWVLAFAVMLLYLNSRAVGRLGAIEYWLVMIKVAAVGLFVVLALLVAGGRDRRTGDRPDQPHRARRLHAVRPERRVAGLLLRDLLLHRRRGPRRHLGRGGRSGPHDSRGDAANGVRALRRSTS